MLKHLVLRAAGISAAACVVLALAAGHAAAAPDYGKQKVVYHLNNGDTTTINKSLGNMLNHIKAVGPENAEIVAVVHGDGIAMFDKKTTTPEIQAKIKNLKMQGVKLTICNNTLTAKKIDFEKDLEGTTDVPIHPAGLPELVKLQQKGYIYVKP